MSKILKAYFSESGTPKTLLAPTITVYNLTDAAIPVAAAAMTEVGGGWYKYTFVTYNPLKEYAFTCDSVTLTGGERYAVGELAAQQVDLYSVNSVKVTGTGVEADPWRPV